MQLNNTSSHIKTPESRFFNRAYEETAAQRKQI